MGLSPSPRRFSDRLLFGHFRRPDVFRSEAEANNARRQPAPPAARGAPRGPAMAASGLRAGTPSGRTSGCGSSTGWPESGASATRAAAARGQINQLDAAVAKLLGQDVRRRDRILNREVDADAADRRHGMGRVADAQQPADTSAAGRPPPSAA